MDIIISFLLLVIAVGLFYNKPINININHKYEHVQNDVVVEAPEQPKEEDQPLNMNEVIQSINEIMGVDYDGDNSK